MRWIGVVGGVHRWCIRWCCVGFPSGIHRNHLARLRLTIGWRVGRSHNRRRRLEGYRIRDLSTGWRCLEGHIVRPPRSRPGSLRRTVGAPRGRVGCRLVACTHVAHAILEGLVTLALIYPALRAHRERSDFHTSTPILPDTFVTVCIVALVAISGWHWVCAGPAQRTFRKTRLFLHGLRVQVAAPINRSS